MLIYPSQMQVLTHKRMYVNPSKTCTTHNHKEYANSSYPLPSFIINCIIIITIIIIIIIVIIDSFYKESRCFSNHQHLISNIRSKINPMSVDWITIVF